MKKNILLIILLISAACALKNVGMYDSSYLLQAQSYTLKLPQALTIPANMNNRYNLPISPIVTVNGESIAIAPKITLELVSGEKNKYSFESEIQRGYVKINERVEIKENHIVTTLTVTNNGNDDVSAKILYNINSVSPSTFFFPALYDKKQDNYFVMTEPREYGNSLGIQTNVPLPEPTSTTNFFQSSNYIFGTETSKLGRGQSITTTVIFYPFNLQREMSAGYPKEYTSYFYNTAVKTSGVTKEINYTNETKADDLIKELRKLPKAEDGEFAKITDTNLEASLNSLGTSLYAKELCRKMSTPCRLLIGRDNENKSFAWIQMYGNSWEDIDTYNGQKAKPVGYYAYYEEPALELKTLPSIEPKDESYYQATSWMNSIGQSYVAIYMILIIAAGIAILLIAQMKAGLITTYIGKEKEAPEKPVEGRFEILKDKEPGDDLQAELMRMIRKNDGWVNKEKYSEMTHYSQELISFNITYLADQGYIKHTGEGIKTAPNAKKPFKVSKQRKTIIMMITAAAVALAVFLLIS